MIVVDVIRVDVDAAAAEIVCAVVDGLCDGGALHASCTYFYF